MYAAASGTYGAPSFPWLAAIASATILACAAGYSAGLVIGARWYTAPIAAVGYFAAYVLLQVAPTTHGVRSLFPAIPNRDTEFAAYIVTTMWGQTVFFLCMSALLVLVVARPGGVIRERSSYVTAAPVVIVALLAAGSVLGTNGQYLTGHNPRDFACGGSDPRICLNRGYAAAAEGLQERFQALNSKVAGTGLQARVLEQNVEGIGDAPSAGARSVYIEGIDSAGLDQSVSRYVGKYGALGMCDLERAPYETVTAVLIVDTWLSGFDEYGLNDLDPAAVGASQWQRVKTLSPPAGNEWLQDHWDVYSTCDLTLTDLP